MEKRQAVAQQDLETSHEICPLERFGYIGSCSLRK